MPAPWPSDGFASGSWQGTSPMIATPSGSGCVSSDGSPRAIANGDRASNSGLSDPAYPSAASWRTRSWSDSCPRGQQFGSAAHTCRETLTDTSGTGLTGSDSRAAERPRRRPVTAWRPWWVDGGTSSTATAHSKALSTCRMRRLTPLQRRSGPDVGLAQGLEGHRTEVASNRVAVELPQEPQRPADVDRLAGGFAILDVGPVRELGKSRGAGHWTRCSPLESRAVVCIRSVVGHLLRSSWPIPWESAVDSRYRTG